jgi:hypothetical protein
MHLISSSRDRPTVHDNDSSTPPYPYFPGGSLANCSSVPSSPCLVAPTSNQQPLNLTNQFLIRFLGANFEPSAPQVARGGTQKKPPKNPKYRERERVIDRRRRVGHCTVSERDPSPVSPFETNPNPAEGAYMCNEATS